MKRILLTYTLLVCITTGYGNAAMPGMWSAGHGGRFLPLFKSDSVHLGKIQMQRELVLVNLYPGFAAVKGEYWMMNTTNEPVSLRVGYPINGRYSQSLVQNVMFRDLYQLRALVNDQPAHVMKAVEGYDSVYRGIQDMQADNWYYFQCTFLPKQLTKITVYFLTNNSEAQLSRGYSRDEGNAFAYILETGRAWAGKIEEGRVLIQLNGGLSLNDFRGVYPVNTLFGNEKHLQFTFTNLEPDSTDNILLWYEQKTPDGFSFTTVTASAGKYYRALDAFPLKEFGTNDLKRIDKDDFTPHDKGLQWILWILIGLLVLGVAILVFLVWRIVRFIRRRRRQKE